MEGTPAYPDSVSVSDPFAPWNEPGPPEWLEIYQDIIEEFCNYSWPPTVDTKQDAIDDLEGLINGVSERLTELREARS